ncbi:MAG: hypothetical protein NVS4B8_14830 [Herpetosiphon sp.]
MFTKPQADGPNDRSSHWLWLGPFLFMLLVSLYMIMRFDGRWAEADSSTFSNVIREFLASGQLVPQASQFVYPNGFAFQFISSFIIAITGLDVQTLQQLVYPVLSALLVFPAWILYREWTGSARGATLTTMLLFTQPEFLFVILRSSHEKFTRMLLLLSFYLLTRSLSIRRRPWIFASYIGLFYLTIFAAIASNNLIADSFIIAIAGAVPIAWFLGRRSAELHTTIPKRLLYATAIGLLLFYCITFYVYPPAQHDLLVLRTMWEKVSTLFLDVQPKQGGYAGAYQYVAGGWIGLPAYFLVSIANWIMLTASVIVWVPQMVRWIWRHHAPTNDSSRLLLLLYGAFALQGALSVLVDASGALGSNLQHRLFPSFNMVAVAIVGQALQGWHPRRLRRSVQAVSSLGIAVLAVLSILKATNEPLLSNKWTFYRASEMQAIQWADKHLHDADLWTEFDERLSVAFLTTQGQSQHANVMRGGVLRPTNRTILLSVVTRLRSARINAVIPVPTDAFRVYDNGEAEWYHIRPKSLYQP